MTDQDRIKQALEEHAGVLEGLKQQAAQIEEMGRRTVESLRRGGKLLICGNGGSASQADHFAGEIVGRFVEERRGLPAIALSAGQSSLTAIGNDYGYDQVFARQVEAYGAEGDLLIALSTSGNSLNVLRAVERARQLNLVTLGLAGRDGGKLAGLCDTCLTIHSNSTARIQEMHILAIHLICEAVDRAFVGD